MLLALTGCQGLDAWAEFDRLELGKPLPTVLPEGMVATPLGAWGAMVPDGRGPSSSNAAARSVNALVNGTGSVIAKSDLELTFSHQLLFVVGRFKYVIELDVPVEAFAPPSAGRETPLELRAAALMAQGCVVGSPPVGADAATQPNRPRSGSLEEARSQVNACLTLLRRSRELFLKRTHGGWAMLSLSKTALDASGALAARTFKASALLTSLPQITGEHREKYAIDTVPEAVLYHKILLDAATRPQRESGPRQGDDPSRILAAFIPYSKWVLPRVIELLASPGPFAEALDENSHRHTTTLDGISIDVRNLGGRRVRIEVGGFVVRDPIIAPLMLLE